MIENLKERYKIIESGKRNYKVRAQIVEMVNRDFIFFFNYFVYTYDPRTKSKTLPFLLYGFQRDFCYKLNECYELKKPLLVEKSRDMGFSWVFLGWIVWKMITEKGFSAGVGSRKFGLVDEIGNMKSLLQRIRFILWNLPGFLTHGYNEKKHSKIGLIKIPEMESYVAGEGGDDIGRGDRTSIYFIDEFAHIPRSVKVQEAVSQTSNCLVYGSTPNGRGNEFARLRWETDIDIFTMHWRDHPGKTQEWYDKMAATLPAETMAQEVDISYNKSIKGRVYKWFSREKHAVDVEYNPNHPVLISIDWGIGDPTSVIFLQDYHGQLRIFDHWEEADRSIPQIFTEIARILGGYKAHHGRFLTLRDVSGWYGDPDAKNRERISGDSISSYIYDKYHITLRMKVPNVIKNRILSVNMLGSSDRILVNKRLNFFCDCVENYKYPEKDHGENEKPLHDWTSHANTALEYYCVYEHGLDQFSNKETGIYLTPFR